jgi:O-antigen ligase
VWGFIVAGHHALLAPLFIHLGLLLAGTALLIRLLLLLLARLLLTTAALLLIALIGHQVAPWFDKRKTLAQVRRSFATLWQTVASRPYQWATGN